MNLEEFRIRLNFICDQYGGYGRNSSLYTDVVLKIYDPEIGYKFIDIVSMYVGDNQDSLNKFIEVFRSLTDTPTNTVHGLWSELFLIENCKNPRILLNYRHQIPEEKFDFNAGSEKIEVKSSSVFERIHTFSSDQLHPPVNTQVLIASIFVRQSNNGLNIQKLIDSIITKIQFNIELSDKLNNIVCKTLGNSLEQSIKIKFDFNIAKESLRFYRHQDIKKIEEIHIPKEVTEVRYKSDLTALSPIDINKISKNGQLFGSL